MADCQKVCLVVIDGWGISEATHGERQLQAEELVLYKCLLHSKLIVFFFFTGNAIRNAATPVMDALSQGQYVTLDASGNVATSHARGTR